MKKYKQRGPTPNSPSAHYMSNTHPLKFLSRLLMQKPCPHDLLKAAPLLSFGNEYCLRQLGKKIPKISAKLTPKIPHWHDYSELKEVSD